MIRAGIGENIAVFCMEEYDPTAKQYMLGHGA